MRTVTVARLLLLLPVAALAACSGGRYCAKEQPYQNAQSIPPIQGVDGLKLPESTTALRVPPPPDKPVAFGTKVTDDKGKERYDCLDQPPQMPPPKDAPPAAAPAPKSG